MVFSVQQGEHGPLVVYKLRAPNAPAAATPVAPPAEPAYVLPSHAPARAPAVLGTVVMPADGVAAPAQVTAGGATAGGTTGRWEAGDVVTLKQVNDEIVWRRETADSLPEVPFAPRF